MIDLTNIIEAAVALLAAILSAVLIPWIRSKLTAAQTAELLRWVDIAVAAAQQLYHQADGKRRLDYALELLSHRGYDINDSSVLDAVEAAVLKLHRQLAQDVPESGTGVGV